MNNKMITPELQQAVTNYRLGNEATQLLAVTPLVVVASVSGAGKNTVINKVLQTGKFHYIVSHTTRIPRENDGIMEQNGREYWFVTPQEMLEKLHKGEMVEAQLIHNRQVSGTSIDELKKAQAEHKIPITEIEYKGVEEVKQYKMDVVAIFIVPPSFETWMQRLDKRGIRDQDELKARLQTAVQELEHVLNSDYYHFVINNDLNQAAKDLEQIVLGSETRADQEEAVSKVWHLLNDLKAHLSS